MKNLILLLLLFSTNLYSQDYYPLDLKIGFSSSNGYEQTFPFRLYNPCHDSVILKLDADVFSAPDRIQLLNYFTEEIMYDSCLFPYNVNTPDSQNGFIYITNDSYQTLSDSIPLDFGINSWNFNNILRFEIGTSLDFFLVRVFTSSASSGSIYVHDPNLVQNIPEVYFYEDRYVCYESNIGLDTIRYSGSCYDSIVVYNDIVYSIENNVFTYTVCKGEDFYLENPLSGELSGIPIEWSDGETEDHWIGVVEESNIISLNYIFKDCVQTSFIFLDVNENNYNSLIMENYELYENEWIKIDFLPYYSTIESVIVNGILIDDYIYLEQFHLDQQLIIVITDVEGCVYEYVSNIKVYSRSNTIYFPNSFSPNYDGINDFFKIYPIKGYIKEVKTFIIFDRWGGILYKDNSLISRWNGIMPDGKVCDNGVYLYYYEIVNFKGEIEKHSSNIQIIK